MSTPVAPLKPVAPIQTPNFQQGAADQGQANLNAGQQTVNISNPNITNPYGSQTVTYGPDGQPTVNQTLSGPGQQQLDSLNQWNQDIGRRNIYDMTSTPMSAYSFSGVDPLNLDALPGVSPLHSDGLFDIKPINTGDLTARKTMPTTEHQSLLAEALRQREAPRMQQARSQSENDLLVRGFNPGTEGYDNRMDEVSRKENDFNLGLTALSGQEQSRLFDMESSLRGQELNEMVTGQSSAQSARGQLFGERSAISDFEKGMREMGLNEQLAVYDTQRDTRDNEVWEAITARRLPVEEYEAVNNAMNPTMPQFQQYTGTNIDPAPTYDATVQGGLFDLTKYGIDNERTLTEYGINVDRSNARDNRKNAESNSKRQGWGDLAAAGITALAFSDIRLKDNLKLLGTTPGGNNWYSWDWKPFALELVNGQPNCGVVAQELFYTNPDAVTLDQNGWLKVNYAGVQ